MNVPVATAGGGGLDLYARRARQRFGLGSARRALWAAIQSLAADSVAKLVTIVGLVPSIETSTPNPPSSLETMR